MGRSVTVTVKLCNIFYFSMGYDDFMKIPRDFHANSLSVLIVIR